MMTELWDSDCAVAVSVLTREQAGKGRRVDFNQRMLGMLEQKGQDAPRGGVIMQPQHAYECVRSGIAAITRAVGASTPCLLLTTACENTQHRSAQMSCGTSGSQARSLLGASEGTSSWKVEKPRGRRSTGSGRPWVHSGCSIPNTRLSQDQRPWEPPGANMSAIVKFVKETYGKEARPVHTSTPLNTSDSFPLLTSTLPCAEHMGCHQGWRLEAPH